MGEVREQLPAAAGVGRDADHEDLRAATRAAEDQVCWESPQRFAQGKTDYPSAESGQCRRAAFASVAELLNYCFYTIEETTRQYMTTHDFKFFAFVSLL